MQRPRDPHFRIVSASAAHCARRLRTQVRPSRYISSCPIESSTHAICGSAFSILLYASADASRCIATASAVRPISKYASPMIEHRSALTSGWSFRSLLRRAAAFSRISRRKRSVFAGRRIGTGRGQHVLQEICNFFASGTSGARISAWRRACTKPMDVIRQANRQRQTDSRTGEQRHLVPSSKFAKSVGCRWWAGLDGFIAQIPLDIQR